MPYHRAMTILLSNDEVHALLTMPECIAVLDSAYRQLAEGQAVGGANSEAVAPGGSADRVYQLKNMSGVVPGEGVAALRLTSDIIAFDTQRQRKLPLAPGGRYTGLILLFSTTTGEPLAIFPDGIVQRMRVGATSALGAKYLARADARSVGLLGAGAQAEAQLLAITATHRIETIRCYSPGAERRATFCNSMSAATGISVEAVERPEQAVRDADIVLCATNSAQPVFDVQWFAEGMHLSTIRGAELTPEVIRRADAVVIHERRVHGSSVATRDVRLPEVWMAIAGMPEIERAATLAELMAGRARGRTRASERTCFVNIVGIGLQFAAVGALVYRKALAAGCGRQLPSEWFTEREVP